MAARRRRAAKREAPAPPAPLPTVGPAGLWIGRIACGLVAGAAFLLAFHKIDDFDTWWHLSAGRWIAVHHAIPATDTLSWTVRDHPWINLQWGFDLALYRLYATGGATLVCLAIALVFTATVLLLLRLVALRAGAGVAAVVVFLVVVAAQERITVRPEVVSFLLLTAVLVTLDRAKQHDGRGLFLLVPLMLAWANLHSLWAVGAFAIVCAAIGDGTAPPRRLLYWGGAALAAVIVNPFGVTGVLFPLKLVSRINGSSAVFHTIGEFESPFAAGVSGTSIAVYKILLAVFTAVALAALVLDRSRARRPREPNAPGFDWGGVIFFGGLVVVSAAAIRNVALFAIGATPFIARCLQILLNSRLLGTPMVRSAPIAATLAALAAVGLGATTVTGAFYRNDAAAREFGPGVIDGTFPIRAAEFARAAALPPPLYNDMSSGGYLTWDDPLGRGVFVDGRLEVYDTPFVTEFVTALSDPDRWLADADRYGLQTAIVFHRFENGRVLVGSVIRSPRWRLVYVDEVAVILLRAQGNEAAIARAASLRPAWAEKTVAWLSRPIDSRSYPAGRALATRAYARVLATTGAADGAIAAYLKYLELGVPPRDEIDVRLLLMRYFARHGRVPEAQEQARRILTLDPGNPDARAGAG